MNSHDPLAQAVRREWGRLSALLLAQFRRLDLIEDALGDAVEAAARRWPADGVPREPAAWLLSAARRRVLDRLRAEAMARRKAPLLVSDHAPDSVRADPGGLIEDDLLRLVLMCAHPALDQASASALALRLVLGVSTADIARLFLVPTPTMAARLTRAKRKITAAGIPFTIPDATVLPERLAGVAQVAYLAFTAGYAPASGPDAVRTELAGEAIRLVRVVLGLQPEDPTLRALLALMLLQHSRRAARVDDDGAIVLLPDQDRSRWHADEIAEATELLAQIQGRLSAQAGGYLLQALIAAEHATAPSSAATDWDRVVRLYDDLRAVQDGPAVALARAVAVAEASGPRAGLAELEAIPDQLGHRLPAVRAELLARAGDRHAAASAYGVALQRCTNDAEAALLRVAVDRVRGPQG